MSTGSGSSPVMSRGCSMLFALPFLVVGACIIAISLGWLPSDPESIKAPRLVLAGAGMVFALGGLMVLLQGSFGPGAQQSAIYRWLEFFVMGSFLLVFASIFLWVGFGPGERAFQSSTSLGPVTSTGQGDSLTGRCMFGTFGLGTLLAGLFFIYKKIMTLPIGDDQPSE